MNPPFFYNQDVCSTMLTLNEQTSKHIINVLRMKAGDALHLTDGKGNKAKAVIAEDNRKHCVVRIEAIEKEVQTRAKISIGISIIKNTSRFEWFLEKATEIGVNEIIPLLCERTEKTTFRHDRMQGILISAMLQSQQSWLPHLHEPTAFTAVIVSALAQQKFIAHCLPEKKTSLIDERINNATNQLILIGPEGDFTEKEILFAIENKFRPVGLGNTRLRTETAGVVAATLLKMI